MEGTCSSLHLWCCSSHLFPSPFVEFGAQWSELVCLCISGVVLLISFPLLFLSLLSFSLSLSFPRSLCLSLSLSFFPFALALLMRRPYMGLLVCASCLLKSFANSTKCYAAKRASTKRLPASAPFPFPFSLPLPFPSALFSFVLLFLPQPRRQLRRPSLLPSLPFPSPLLSLVLQFLPQPRRRLRRPSLLFAFAFPCPG